MENQHDPNHSANNGEFERGQEDHGQQPGNSSPEPLGVPDAWMELLGDGDCPDPQPPEEPSALQKGPQGASPAQSSLDLIHQLLDQLSVQVKAQEWVLKQLQREDYLRGDYRVERYQQIWEPLHRSDSLKEQIFQLEEQGVRLPLNDLAEKVLSAAPRALNSQWVLEEWLKQIDLYLNQNGNGDSHGEDSSL